MFKTSQNCHRKIVSSEPLCLFADFLGHHSAQGEWDSRIFCEGLYQLGARQVSREPSDKSNLQILLERSQPQCVKRMEPIDILHNSHAGAQGLREFDPARPVTKREVLNPSYRYNKRISSRLVQFQFGLAYSRRECAIRDESIFLRVHHNSLSICGVRGN